MLNVPSHHITSAQPTITSHYPSSSLPHSILVPRPQPVHTTQRVVENTGEIRLIFTSRAVGNSCMASLLEPNKGCALGLTSEAVCTVLKVPPGRGPAPNVGTWPGVYSPFRGGASVVGAYWDELLERGWALSHNLRTAGF